MIYAQEAISILQPRPVGVSVTTNEARMTSTATGSESVLSQEAVLK